MNHFRVMEFPTENPILKIDKREANTTQSNLSMGRSLSLQKLLLVSIIFIQKSFLFFFYQKWRWTFQAFRLQIRFWQNFHLPVWSGEIWREMEKSGLFVRDSIFLSLLLYEYFLFRWRRNIKLLTSHSGSASSVFTTNKKVNGITLLACSENTAIIALYTE